MGEISKTVGQWVVGNVGWTAIIILFVLSGLFKLVRIEIDPIGWIIGWIGKKLTQDVRTDVADFKKENDAKFKETKIDRAAKIEELKNDYNEKIGQLRADLDAFEIMTNKNMAEMRQGTTNNCELLKVRLDAMERSNDMQTIRQIKAHVLDFANSCLNHVRHTKKEFDNIIKENQEYEELISKYKLKNDVYTEDYNFILKLYHKCQDEDSWLRDET